MTAAHHSRPTPPAGLPRPRAAPAAGVAVRAAVRPATTRCPQCDGPVAADPRYSPWCTACGWNADPHPAAPLTGAPARWRRRALRRAAADHARAMRTTPARAVRARWLAVLAALPVLVPSALLLLLDGVVLLGDSGPFWKLVVTGLVVAVLRVVVPRPERAPSGPGVLTPDDAPATFALLEAVAREVGARTPSAVVCDDTTTASRLRRRGRRGAVLRIGVPGWNVLEDAQRVALLAHLVAHEVSGDPRDQPFVRFALGTRELWLWLLRAGPPSEVARAVLSNDHVILYTGHAWRPADGRLLNALSRGLLAVLAAVVRVLGAGLVRVVGPAALAAEYGADERAARAAGRDGVVGWLRAGLVGPQVHQAYLTATNRGDADVRAGQRDLFSRMPVAEIDRAERRARDDGLVAEDAGHPPTCRRLGLLRDRPDPGARVHLPAGSSRAVDDELWRGLRQALSGLRR